MTELDDRLRRHASGWQAALPSPRGLDPASLEDGPRRVWVAAVVAAAAVLVIVAGGLAVRGNGERADPLRTDDVVPWRALPATHPTLPAQSIGPDPAPTPPAGTPTCRGDDVDVVEVVQDGATGRRERTYEARTGRDGCLIQGYPEVTPLAAGAPLHVPVLRMTGNAPPVRPVWVRPGHPARFNVEWDARASCPVTNNDQLRITPPGTQVVALPGFGRSACEGDGPAPMFVYALWQPPTQAGTRVVSPYDALRITSGGEDPSIVVVTADDDGQARFTVTFESPKDLSLVPCPDYAITTAAGRQAWGLNCAGVPHRDSAGKPYLPANTPVRFAMEADSGGRSTDRFFWELTGNVAPHVLNGVVTVSGDEHHGSLSAVVMLTGGPSGAKDTRVTTGEIRVRGPVERTVRITDKPLVDLGSLPPGRYQLTTVTPQWNGGSSFGMVVHVRAGITTIAKVDLPRR